MRPPWWDRFAVSWFAMKRHRGFQFAWEFYTVLGRLVLAAWIIWGWYALATGRLP